MGPISLLIEVISLMYRRPRRPLLLIFRPYLATKTRPLSSRRPETPLLVVAVDWTNPLHLSSTIIGGATVRYDCRLCLLSRHKPSQAVTSRSCQGKPTRHNTLGSFGPCKCHGLSVASSAPYYKQCVTHSVLVGSRQFWTTFVDCGCLMWLLSSYF